MDAISPVPKGAGSTSATAARGWQPPVAAPGAVAHPQDATEGLGPHGARARCHGGPQICFSQSYTFFFEGGIG